MAKPQGETLGEMVQETRAEKEEEKSFFEKLDDYIYNNPIDLGGGGVTEDGKVDISNRDNNNNNNNNNTPSPPPTPAPTPVPVPMPDQIRNELKGWGGTTEQIDQILASLGENDLDVLLDELKNVPQEDRIVYLIDNFGDAVTDWGGAGGTQAIPLNDATRASELQKPQDQRLQEAVDRQVLGSSTGEGLTENADGSFTDPNTGTTYYRGDDGKLTDRDGNVRYDPGTGLAAEIDYNREQQSLAEQGLYGNQGVVSDIQQTATDYGDFADQTRASLDDPRNDFALQITGEINNFLNGRGTGKGFLDYQADLLGAGDTFKQQMGVLSQQYDDAYAQNQGDINRLRGDYASMTETYAKELNPLRNDLGGVRDRLGRFLKAKWTWQGMLRIVPTTIDSETLSTQMPQTTSDGKPKPGWTRSVRTLLLLGQIPPLLPLSLQ